jgi:type I restriction enzyme S subunit
MSEWKKVKIGEFLEKKSICAENLDNYKELQVLGVSNKLGITITDHKKSKDISKYLYIEENYFAYNPYRINVGSIGLTTKNVNGLVSPAYIVFKTKEHLLLPELLLGFLKSNDGLIQINKLAKGTVRKSLSFNELCNIQMAIPPIEKQHKILNIKKSIQTEIDLLLNENAKQQSYLKKLRQAILQEAIEGQLTANWRLNNPIEKGNPNFDAHALLASIKEQKQQLIAEGKIKKEKLLAPINNDDVPFALPDGWVWVRLGEITLYSEAGKSFLCIEREINNEEWGVVKVSSVSWGEFRERENKLYSKEEPENVKYKINIGDFLISRANTTDLVGRSVIVRELSRNLLLSDKIIRFVFSFEIIKEFSNHFNASIYSRNHFENRATGSSPSMKNVNRSDMELLVIPLPPLTEQHAIVERVDKLLAQVNALQIQVSEREHYAQQLMQAVLKEAFAA